MSFFTRSGGSVDVDVGWEVAVDVDVDGADLGSVMGDMAAGASSFGRFAMGEVGAEGGRWVVSSVDSLVMIIECFVRRDS